MTILSRIRSRVALLVGIIFVAILAFVLTDVFSGQSGLMGGGGPGDVGSINGSSISYKEFDNKVKSYSSDDNNMSEQQRQQLSDGVWAEMIDQLVYQPEYDDLGIMVTTDELAEQMMGDKPSDLMRQYFQDPQSGQIAPQYANADGSLNGKAIRDLVKKFQPKDIAQWEKIEQEMQKRLVREKYNTLIRKGLFVTQSQAIREDKEEKTNYAFKYFVKRYSEIADSTIKCTDEELKAYYKANPHKFKQAEDARSIEFVSFDVLPTADDIAKQREELTGLMADFKTKTGRDDTAFVASYSADGAYTSKMLRPGTYPVGTDSMFIKANAGDVLGPFSIGENNVIYKVLGQRFSSDSAKVRHILVAMKGGTAEATRTKEQAKLRADSIAKVIKGGKKMEDLVEKLTDDQGSKAGNKGDYGWFTQETGFVQPFKDAGFNNPKGAVVVVETQFGYHVIQVLDRTKESRKTEVVGIERKTEPSEQTITAVFTKAAEFGGKNNNLELFNKAVTDGKLAKQPGDNITESSRFISGIDQPRPVVQWMFADKTEIGSVSEPFTSDNQQTGAKKYVVCVLTKITEKGTKPFEDKDVRTICELEVRKKKKVEQFTKEINSKKAATIDAWAANLKLTPTDATANFANAVLPMAGNEGRVVGWIAGNPATGKLSVPIAGDQGVYVVVINSVTPAEPLKDVKTRQQSATSAIGNQADSRAAEVLRDEADIEDHRGTRYF
ncbi:MAG: SurA N-terminal domain-containing protein [Bacteroidia bacterium]|jgi:peptidyl-prolyl cis-trans isomerase D|nr:SurA N-terminal domain-containing protein [Bacteroidia bacterium]